MLTQSNQTMKPNILFFCRASRSPKCGWLSAKWNAFTSFIPGTARSRKSI
jgi:hypothetical protein